MEIKGRDAQTSFPWEVGVYDAHCHPTDTMSSVQKIRNMNARGFAIMATRSQDQQLVANVASQYAIAPANPNANDREQDSDGRFVVPSFGWHPWFSHQLFDDQQSDSPSTFQKSGKAAHYKEVLVPGPCDDEFLSGLPEPTSLSQFLMQTRSRLEQFPKALVGEIGLDKSFRIPISWALHESGQRDDSLTPGGREGRSLSPYRVRLEHQQKIFMAQLRLASVMQRAVSIHGVQAHGFTFDSINEVWKGHEIKMLSNRQRRRAHIVEQVENGEHDHHQEVSNVHYPPRICLHSFSGPTDLVARYTQAHVPIQVYFSFSKAINFSSLAASRTREVIKMIPRDRILVESDLHVAGSEMDANLEAIIRIICELKSWPLREGIIQLKSNWTNFIGVS